MLTFLSSVPISLLSCSSWLIMQVNYVKRKEAMYIFSSLTSVFCLQILPLFEVAATAMCFIYWVYYGIYLQSYFYCA